MQERKLNKLPSYDYAQKGAFFITICVHNREKVFGKIFNGEMILNEYGKVVEMQWQILFEQYKCLEIDEYVIIPDRFHAILRVVGNEPVKPLSKIISVFKTTSSKLIHQLGNANFQWQKSYLDEIISDEKSLDNIRNYIINSPAGADDE
jgi:putative transposase